MIAVVCGTRRQYDGWLKYLSMQDVLKFFPVTSGTDLCGVQNVTGVIRIGSWFDLPKVDLVMIERVLQSTHGVKTGQLVPPNTPEPSDPPYAVVNSQVQEENP